MLRTSTNGMAHRECGLQWSGEERHPLRQIHISAGIAETARWGCIEKRVDAKECLHRETCSETKMTID
jgi:hypothetical protein